jgi:hypothetical protein
MKRKAKKIKKIDYAKIMAVAQFCQGTTMM